MTMWQGFMENTILFYGYYFNKTFEWSVDSTNVSIENYNMPLAYILAILIYLIVSLILMVVK